MTNSRGQELYTLVGTVVRKFAPEQKGKYLIHKFLLTTTDGKSVYVSSFKALNIEVGADVEFQASKFNETNYTVQGDIKSATAQVAKAVDDFNAKPPFAETTTTTRRRGRPAKATGAALNETTEGTPYTTVTAVVPEKTAVDVPITGRELYRGEAEKGAYVNIQSAVRVLDQLGLKGTVADLVAVADLIGRTQTAIFMDAQKDNRMAKFNR